MGRGARWDLRGCPLGLSYGKMKKDNSLNGEAFNFGPKIENKKTVLQVVKEMKKGNFKGNPIRGCTRHLIM